MGCESIDGWSECEAAAKTFGFGSQLQTGNESAEAGGVHVQSPKKIKSPKSSSKVGLGEVSQNRSKCRSGSGFSCRGSPFRPGLFRTFPRSLLFSYFWATLCYCFLRGFRVLWVTWAVTSVHVQWVCLGAHQRSGVTGIGCWIGDPARRHSDKISMVGSEFCHHCLFSVELPV